MQDRAPGRGCRSVAAQASHPLWVLRAHLCFPDSLGNERGQAHHYLRGPGHRALDPARLGVNPNLPPAAQPSPGERVPPAQTQTRPCPSNQAQATDSRFLRRLRLPPPPPGSSSSSSSSPSLSLPFLSPPSLLFLLPSHLPLPSPHCSAAPAAQHRCPTPLAPPQPPVPAPGQLVLCLSVFPHPQPPCTHTLRSPPPPPAGLPGLQSFFTSSLAPPGPQALQALLPPVHPASLIIAPGHPACPGPNSMWC